MALIGPAKLIDHESPIESESNRCLGYFNDPLGNRNKIILEHFIVMSFTTVGACSLIEK